MPPRDYGVMTIAKTRIAAIIGCVGLFACGPSGDWRAQAVADAENQIRTAVNDPSAEFSSVQVTGDDTTGQTCGFVSAKISTGGEQSGHFIVYIDGSAGPYIENNLDGQSMPHEKFEFAWENDCLKEGYKD